MSRLRKSAWRRRATDGTRLRCQVDSSHDADACQISEDRQRAGEPAGVSAGDGI